MKREIRDVKQLKLNLQDQFKLLRDDRSAIFKKIDNSSHEIKQYRELVLKFTNDSSEKLNRALDKNTK